MYILTILITYLSIFIGCIASKNYECLPQNNTLSGVWMTVASGTQDFQVVAWDLRQNPSPLRLSDPITLPLILDGALDTDNDTYYVIAGTSSKQYLLSFKYSEPVKSNGESLPMDQCRLSSTVVESAICFVWNAYHQLIFVIGTTVSVIDPVSCEVTNLINGTHILSQQYSCDSDDFGRVWTYDNSLLQSYDLTTNTITNYTINTEPSFWPEMVYNSYDGNLYYVSGNEFGYRISGINLTDPDPVAILLNDTQTLSSQWFYPSYELLLFQQNDYMCYYNLTSQAAPTYGVGSLPQQCGTVGGEYGCAVGGPAYDDAACFLQQSKH